MALPFVVHPSEWTIARLIDHVDHLAETIGIGTSASAATSPARSSARAPAASRGLDHRARGPGRPGGLPGLFEALRERGYGDDDLRAIGSENLLRVLRRTLPA